MPDQKRSPKAGRESCRWFVDAHFRARNLSRITTDEVIHGCFGRQSADRRQDAKGIARQKMMLLGWPPTQGSLARGMNSMG